MLEASLEATTVTWCPPIRTTAPVRPAHNLAVTGSSVEGPADEALVESRQVVLVRCGWRR
jgi:hypothetical protein